MSHSVTTTAGRPSWPWFLLALLAWGVAGLVAVHAGIPRPGTSESGRGASDAGALLVEYFRLLLADRDFNAFRDRVTARYSEATLCHLLSGSPGVATRRAAVVALSSIGGFRRSNPALGRALRDVDPVVRQLAEEALWSVWLRADTPENNRSLQEIVQLIARGEIERAEALATRLILTAPHFAEAYNQRAIIYFNQNRFAESALDCERVLKVNPYHFGAMSGLAQCQMHLNRPAEALKTLRRVSRLQPYNLRLRDNIRQLEAQVELEESR